MERLPTQGSGFVPTVEDRASIDAWFARYDAHAAKAHVDSMADMAIFPLNLVTDDSEGNGSAWQWTREQFIDGMTGAMGESGGVTMESTRTPFFLTKQLVFVITDAVLTANGATQQLRYADLLVKRDGQWFFQTMVQGGWGGR